MKKMISAILALALCCLLVTAVADEASPVGAWYIGRAMSNGTEIQVVDPEAIVLTVNEDNTFVLTAAGVSVSGTWTFGDSAITLVPDPQEGAEEQEPVVYRLEDGKLLYDIGTAVIHLSRTPAEAAALSPAVEAVSADEFGGSWKPAAQIVYGLYGPADESGVASLSIEDGKISLLLPGDDGKMAPYGEYEVSFADGVLTAEDTSFGSSGMTLSLHEDGSLFYNVVTDFGTAKLDLTYVYVRGEFEIAPVPKEAEGVLPVNIPALDGAYQPTEEILWPRGYTAAGADTQAPADASAAEAESAEQSDGTLDRVVILSRHNIRSPLSGSGSMLGDITPHEWFRWTSNPSELSLRGAVLETLMGQYFRLWLEQKGLFPENYQPEEGAVRFYANAKQRTIATARYFSAGLLPVAAVPIETHVTYDTMDPVFDPTLNFVTEEYIQDAITQIAEKGGETGLDGILSGLNGAISLLIDTADIEQSEAYQAGKYGDFKSGDTVLTMETGQEPKMTGPIKNATSVADAMILQYYEEPDKQKAAFGHDLTDEDWRLIHSIVDTYSDMLFCSPLVSVNVAHPLLEEIRAELSAEGRKLSFLCGHDANIASVLAALNYGDYLLPVTVEQHTPIGVKLVFERWVNAENEAYYKISLVYQSTAQLRSMEQLTLENPPVVYPLHFEGMDSEGRIAETDLLRLLDDAISAYDELVEQYTTEEAMDDAA